jgi:phosphoribosylglycinamide formyltransferase-1
VLRQEHVVYPQAVRWFAEGRLRLEGGRVRVAAEATGDGALVAPELRRN